MDAAASPVMVLMIGGTTVALTTMVQVAIGYVFKQLFEKKDAKLAHLETKVSELETQRIKVLEHTVGHNNEVTAASIQENERSAAARRRQIYERLDEHERGQADLKARLTAIEETIPQLPAISRELSATTATLKMVADRVDSINAQQLVIVRDVARNERDRTK
jgi:chromosome segregation ATPase